MLYTQILNKNREFLYMYNKGQSVVGKFAVVYFKSNNKPYNRLGVTAGKKIGNAVTRNRAKRIIRQAYRENELFFPVGIDIVIVARTAVSGIKSGVLSDWLAGECLGKIENTLCKGIKK